MNINFINFILFSLSVQQLIKLVLCVCMNNDVLQLE